MGAVISRLESVTRTTMTRKQMRIGAIGVDKKSGMPLVILHDPTGKLIMPIWIGYAEANALSMAASKTQSPRPTTYELMLSSLKALDVRVKDVSIEANNEGKFEAWINLDGGPNESGGQPLSIEARPSDAIVLSSLADAPLFVSSDIFDAVESELQAKVEEEENQKFKEFLQDLKPGDFAKFALEKENEVSESQANTKTKIEPEPESASESESETESESDTESESKSESESE